MGGVMFCSVTGHNSHIFIISTKWSSYDDDEGDRVLLTTDSDLVGAVNHARSAGQKVLRLHLDYSEFGQRKREHNWLVKAFTELIIADLMYLQWMDPKESIYLYINSTGTTRDDDESILPGKMLVPAVVDQVHAQTLAALQVLKVHILNDEYISKPLVDYLADATWLARGTNNGATEVDGGTTDRRRIEGESMADLRRIDEDDGNGRTVSMWFDNWSSIGPLNQYITHKDLYDASVTGHNSHIFIISTKWSSGKNLSLVPNIMNIEKQSNGRTVSMWFDNWSSIGPLNQYITHKDLYDARLDVDLKVSDMVRNNNWYWPSEWYSKYNVVTNIDVPNINPNKCDEAVWKTSSGMEKEFAVKNVCRDLRSNDPIVTWWKLVWYSQCIPKHAFILWIAINNRMNTQDRLQKWGRLILAYRDNPMTHRCESQSSKTA
ncbi:reverse transcriptase zinc-binding domain-containing protein [Artemisia annua]|uniref:Reverse transcriptase zinc-binding domain-containing protein n=1 Tax=Artemisia annua TaxID=35608 RepID=A0A2U1LGY5_ARTAN|nr:reverse transcriptase zinc-binding domain-containing protein [Artemisia annua]